MNTTCKSVLLKKGGGEVSTYVLSTLRHLIARFSRRWRNAVERTVARRTKGEGVLSDDQADWGSCVLHSEVFSFRQNVHQCGSASNLLKGCYPRTDTGRVFYRNYSTFLRLFNFWRRSKCCLLRKIRNNSQLRSFFKRSECNNFFRRDLWRLILGNCTSFIGGDVC